MMYFRLGLLLHGSYKQINSQYTPATSLQLDHDGIHSTTKPPVSWGQVLSERENGDVVWGYLNELSSPDKIRSSLVSSRVVAGQHLTELFYLIYNYVVRFGKERLRDDESVELLHRSARLVEVMYPRAPRSAKQSLLSLYARVSRRLHSAVFGNQNNYLFALPRPYKLLPVDAKTKDVINIHFTVVGRAFGYRSVRATLNSILHFTTSRINLFITGDKPGYAGFKEAYKGYLTTIAHLSIHFIDIWESKAFLERVELMPSSCRYDGNTLAQQIIERTKYMTGLARLFLDVLIPLEVTKIISIDVGDTVVLKDLSEANQILSSMRNVYMIGAAVETGTFSAGGFANAGNDVEVNATFWNDRIDITKSKPKGINPGILFLQLETIRNFVVPGWNTRWFDALRQSAKISSETNCAIDGIPQMAILNTLLLLKPESQRIFGEISSKWNYAPESAYEFVSSNTNDEGLSSAILSAKLFTGLRPNGRVVHSCAEYAEVAAEWALNEESSQLREKWADAAWNFYDSQSNQFGTSYSVDLECNDEINIVHFNGAIKQEPWARKLMALWGHSPLSALHMGMFNRSISGARTTMSSDPDHTGFFIGYDDFLSHDFIPDLHSRCLATSIAVVYKNLNLDGTVLDFGCGTGDDVQVLRSLQVPSHGYDGNPSTMELSDGRCDVFDLASNESDGEVDKVPILFSFDVVQYIPRAFEENFMTNIVLRNPDFVFISWPGEPSYSNSTINRKINRQVNFRRPAEVVALFQSRGFLLHEYLTSASRRLNSEYLCCCQHLTDHIFVFVRTDFEFGN